MSNKVRRSVGMVPELGMGFHEALNHPLAHGDKIGAVHKGLDSRLNVHLYQQPNKKFTELHAHSEIIPNTELRYVKVKAFHPRSTRNGSEDVLVVMWLRKNSIEKLKEGIATLLMISDAPVVVMRAWQ